MGRGEHSALSGKAIHWGSYDRESSGPVSQIQENKIKKHPEKTFVVLSQDGLQQQGRESIFKRPLKSTDFLFPLSHLGETEAGKSNDKLAGLWRPKIRTRSLYSLTYARLSQISFHFHFLVLGQSRTKYSG